MLVNEQSSNWWLETSWSSCGVTVIATSFRYYKWIRLQGESVDVSLVQVMARRLFGAKPLPGPVEGPVREFGYFFWCSSGDGVEQIVDRNLICDLWRSSGVAVKTILQNEIPRTPNSNIQYNLIRPGIINYKWLDMCTVNPHEIYKIQTTYRTQIYDIRAVIGRRIISTLTALPMGYSRTAYG